MLFSVSVSSRQNAVMLISEISKTITNSLQPLYDAREAAAIAKYYLEERLHCQAYELALRGGEVFPASLQLQFAEDLEKLKTGCPLQYVLGTAEFYGRQFDVTPATLIPRPETEELVMRVVGECLDAEFPIPHPVIWDVGTGSGCIAITLALEIPGATVFATDISAEALAVARCNAEKLGAKVVFAQHDMRDVAHLPFGNQRLDYVVSNPPYIPASVRDQMHANVREFEPTTALFVPDDRPLIFYEALADLSTVVLKPGGYCHCETYDDFHETLTDMFLHKGFSAVESFLDLNDRPRGICAVKNGQEH